MIHMYARERNVSMNAYPLCATVRKVVSSYLAYKTYQILKS